MHFGARRLSAMRDDAARFEALDYIWPPAMLAIDYADD